MTLDSELCENEFAFNVGVGVVMEAVWHLTGMAVFGLERPCVPACG